MYEINQVLTSIIINDGDNFKNYDPFFFAKGEFTRLLKQIKVCVKRITPFILEYGKLIHVTIICNPEDEGFSLIANYIDNYTLQVCVGEFNSTSVLENIIEFIS
jgi:hypothetical protein